jgi:hypothetical protein
MLLASTTACGTLRGIIETDPPPPSEADGVRILCAKNAEGVFVFGVILASRSDTPETQEAIIRQNDAWRAATRDGKLCE